MTTMLVQWLLGSALLALAATAAESALRGRGRPARWVWLGAILGSASLPVLLRYVPRVLPEAAAGSELIGTVALAPLSVDATGASAGAGGEQLLLGIWAAATLVVLAWILAGVLHLRSARRSWQRRAVDGVPVWVARTEGPATVPFLRPSVVVPEWALELAADQRRMLMLHEEEHARAGDPYVLLGALCLVAAVPWNLAMWWQLRRLRQAVELDCDARVLRGGASRQSYGGLLLEAGRRRSGLALAAGLGVFGSGLERRIRTLVDGDARRGLRRTAALATLALGLLVLAVCARDLTGPAPEPEPSVVSPAGVYQVDPDERARRAAVEGEMAAQARFTPFDQAPVPTDLAGVAAELRRHYPPMLREAGIGGTAQVWLFVDETGAVTNTRLRGSSGHEALDEAALRVAETMRFQPARNEGADVAVWIALPMQFSAGGGQEAEPADPAVVDDEPAVRGELTARALRARALRSEIDGPAFTPYDTPPELGNREEVGAALRDAYPPLLRGAGIGGTTNVWFLIDEEGQVLETRIQRSSGHEALDQAALRVAGSMRFSPARQRGEPVKVWVALPITFSAG